MSEPLDVEDIKRRIAAGNHALDNDPGMHTDDKGIIWVQAYGDLWPRIHIPALVAKLTAMQEAHRITLERLQEVETARRAIKILTNEAIDRLRLAEAGAAARLASLQKYGKHDDGCPACWRSLNGDLKCKCGIENALASDAGAKHDAEVRAQAFREAGEVLDALPSNPRFLGEKMREMADAAAPAQPGEEGRDA